MWEKERIIMKTITIVPVPGVATTIGLEANGTLADALKIYAEQAGVDVSKYEVRIGDNTADMTVIPADGTKVFLVQKVKGRA